MQYIHFIIPNLLDRDDSIEVFNLPVRITNALIKGGIENVGDLLDYPENKICFIKNIGVQTRNSILEIKKILNEKYGLSNIKDSKEIFKQILIKNNNNYIKHFIDSQLQPKEKYNFASLEKKFDKFFTREENKILEHYRKTIEEVNLEYLKNFTDENYNISKECVFKLKAFLDVYKFYKKNPDLYKKFNQILSYDQEIIPKNQKENIKIKAKKIYLTDPDYWFDKYFGDISKDSQTKSLRERNAIIFDNYIKSKMTLYEIGKKNNLSRERVRQIINKMLRRFLAFAKITLPREIVSNIYCQETETAININEPNYKYDDSSVENIEIPLYIVVLRAISVMPINFGYDKIIVFLKGGKKAFIPKYKLNESIYYGCCSAIYKKTLHNVIEILVKEGLIETLKVGEYKRSVLNVTNYGVKVLMSDKKLNTNDGILLQKICIQKTDTDIIN